MHELLRRFLPPFRRKALVGIACKAVEVAFDLITPVVIARMIDVGVATRDMGLVVRLGALLLALSVVGYGFTCVCQRLAASVSQGIGTSVRSQLYRRINELGAADVDAFGTPSLVTRVTNDVNQVQVAVAMGVRMLVRWPLIAVGSIVAAMLIDARLGLVFLVCSPAIALVFWLVMGRSVPLFRAIQTKLDVVSRIVREALEGVRVVRAFGREDHEEGRFVGAVRDQASTSVAVGRLSAILSPTTFLIMNLGVVAILWAGAHRVEAGGLTQGEIVAFVNYMTQVLISIGYVANLVVVFTRGSASATRVMEVLDTEPRVRDGSLQGPRSTDREVPAIEFDHVTFSYGAGDAALTDVSFSLPQGTSLGIIGGTGSGKSTLASLAVRLYDPSSGTVRVLGEDARRYALVGLRRIVSIVPQHASLLSGTIRSNLGWRRAAATDDELWQALACAQAEEFVRAKPGLLDAVVEAGGTNFSGGQRQRLTIARALVGAPGVVVLDDAASALDYATDARLRAALRRLPSQPATIVVSQRVAAVMGADQLLVLDHGKVAGLGTHRQLVRSCPIYREICLSQLRPEEVDA
ncbi:MAG: ABC transporter ATP-binding protein [Acidobacteriota bacterium]|nr:ABC transporter ATP-binding protein [Acidobacteriota bacterium]